MGYYRNKHYYNAPYDLKVRIANERLGELIEINKNNPEELKKLKKSQRYQDATKIVKERIDYYIKECVTVA
jgi:hypothetical protein